MVDLLLLLADIPEIALDRDLLGTLYVALLGYARDVAVVAAAVDLGQLVLARLATAPPGAAWGHQHLVCPPLVVKVLGKTTIRLTY